MQFTVQDAFCGFMSFRSLKSKEFFFVCFGQNLCQQAGSFIILVGPNLIVSCFLYIFLFVLIFVYQYTDKVGVYDDVKII